MKNAKKKGGTTANTVPYNSTDKFDFGAARAKFEGIREQANKLPEGKQKTALLSSIEEAYYGIVGWVKCIAKGPIEA